MYSSGSTSPHPGQVLLGTSKLNAGGTDQQHTSVPSGEEQINKFQVASHQGSTLVSDTVSSGLMAGPLGRKACTTYNKKSSPFRSQFFAYAWPFHKLFIPLKFSQKLEGKQKLSLVKID